MSGAQPQLWLQLNLAQLTPRPHHHYPPEGVLSVAVTPFDAAGQWDVSIRPCGGFSNPFEPKDTIAVYGRRSHFALARDDNPDPEKVCSLQHPKGELTVAFNTNFGFYGYLA